MWSQAYDALKQERDTAVRQAQLLAAGFQAVCAEVRRRSMPCSH